MALAGGCGGLDTGPGCASSRRSLPGTLTADRKVFFVVELSGTVAHV